MDISKQYTSLTLAISMPTFWFRKESSKKSSKHRYPTFLRELKPHLSHLIFLSKMINFVMTR